LPGHSEGKKFPRPRQSCRNDHRGANQHQPERPAGCGSRLWSDPYRRTYLPLAGADRTISAAQFLLIGRCDEFHIGTVSTWSDVVHYAYTLSVFSRAASSALGIGAVVNLVDAVVQPTGWPGALLPMSATPTSSVIHELQVRDISANESTNNYFGKYLAFAQLCDCYNWGYYPFHYGAPQGSYVTFRRRRTASPAAPSDCAVALDNLQRSCGHNQFACSIRTSASNSTDYLARRMRILRTRPLNISCWPCFWDRGVPGLGPGDAMLRQWGDYSL